jgi:hypothetical protein
MRLYRCPGTVRLVARRPLAAGQQPADQPSKRPIAEGHSANSCQLFRCQLATGSQPGDRLRQRHVFRHLPEDRF